MYSYHHHPAPERFSSCKTETLYLLKLWLFLLLSILLFSPSGNPRTLSPSLSRLAWSPAAFLHLFFQPPPLMPARAWGWPLLGSLEVLRMARDFGSSVAGFHVAEAMDIPVAVMLTSPRAPFPWQGTPFWAGPTEGWRVGRVDDLCLAASLQHCPVEDPRCMKIHFTLT